MDGLRTDLLNAFSAKLEGFLDCQVLAELKSGPIARKRAQRSQVSKRSTAESCFTLLLIAPRDLTPHS